MRTGACSGSKLDTGAYDRPLPSTPDLKIDRMNKNQQKSSLNVTFLLKMKSLLCMTAYRTLHRKMIKNGYKRRYFGGRESSDWVCAPLVVNFTLAPAGQKQSHGLFSSERCRFAVAVLLSSQSSLQFGFSSQTSGFLCTSRDQTAVDAARAQSSLQGSFLLLWSQDSDDGLVENRLQAFLG